MRIKYFVLMGVFIHLVLSSNIVSAAVTITVTTASDVVAVDGDCSLREAINATNNNATVNECVHDGSGGIDTIEFAIGAPGSVQTITATNSFGISDPVILDGTTQSGVVGCQNITTPLIVLDGSTIVPLSNGITIGGAANGSIVRGLVVENFQRDGIEVYADNSTIQCNFIGTDPTGLIAAGNGRFGILFPLGSSGHIVGTDGDGLNDAFEGNIISGNAAQPGIDVAGGSNIVIAGNKLGTDITGTNSIPNLYGIRLRNGASNNIIGTNGDTVSDDLERNIISGNTQYGVRVDTASTTGNVLAGNYIGLDTTGTTILTNGLDGILLNAASNNIIGTNGDGNGDANEGNLISGNTRDGIRVQSNATLNVIAGNFIGTDVTGTLDLGNDDDGIRLQSGANNNIIGTNGDGTSDALEGNIISGQRLRGIFVSGGTVTANRIAGNFIGTDVTGIVAIPNNREGIRVQSNANNNIIGTDGDGNGDIAERNIISGNTQYGVLFETAGTTGNVLAGNYIGLDITGTSILANGLDGILLSRASNNIIGTNGDGNGDANEGNIISGNTRDGIRVQSNATLNVIAGNYIGTDVTGTLDLGNDDDGIRLVSGANNNIIGTNGDGTSDALEGNIISGNRLRGVFIVGSSSANNIVAGNFIGIDSTGTSSIANDSFGILIQNGSNTNLVGTNADGVSDALERNIISGNGNNGMRVNTGANNNTIAGNYIGTDVNGTVAIPNTFNGIQLRCNVFDNHIGTNGDGVNDVAERNVISGNGANGVFADCQADANSIAGNYIGLAANGVSPIPNGQNGIRINNADGPFTIGGPGHAFANTIGFNTESGILVGGGAQVVSMISYNFIGTNASFANLANGTNGIEVRINNLGVQEINIDHNRIFYHPGTGLLVDGLSNLGVAGVSVRNCIVNNAVGVDNQTGVQINFENNSWGALDGPSGSGTGSGDPVSIDVDYDPFIPTSPDICSPVIASPTVAPAIALFDPAISKIGFLLPGQVGVTGERLEWIVTVTNTGAVVGNNVIVTDTLIDALQIDSVDAPGATVNISGQTVNVTYAVLNPGETVQFSIFTTVLDGVDVTNTACVNADNQGAEECANGSFVATLPQTGESPFWRNWIFISLALTVLSAGMLLLGNRTREI